MALDFSGSGQYITTGFTTGLGDFSAACWFYADSSSSVQRIVDKKFDTGFWMGQSFADGVMFWGGGIRQDTSPFGLYVNAFGTGAWYHLFMSRSGTTQKVVGNGTTSSTQACSGTALDTTALRIAATADSAGNQFDGKVAEFGIWNVALTDAEITSLSKGFKPSRIRPQSLVFYAPLTRATTDLKGASMTVTGSPAAFAHPRVY